MELQEFVKKTLIEINEAVKEANDETKKDIYFSGTKEKRAVEFDVAVTVEQKSTKDAGGKIRVLSFGELGGGLEKGSQYSEVQRISFGVQVEDER